jgi:hypothetical protein
MIAALLQARQYLLSAPSSDMMVIAEVTEQIVALNQRLTEVIASQNLGSLPVSDESALRGAVNTLNSALLGNPTTKEVSAATQGLMRIVGPWPP